MEFTRCGVRSETRDKAKEANRQKEEQNCAPQIYWAIFIVCFFYAKRMSDDGNPGLSDNEDGPSLSVHDEDDDELLTLGIYCDAEFRLQDLKETLKEYARVRNFQATLTQPLHPSITHPKSQSTPNRMTYM